MKKPEDGNAPTATNRTSSEIRDASVARFNSRANEKYDNGQREHGGLLDQRVSFDDIEDEIIDLWFYVQSLKHKLSQDDFAKSTSFTSGKLHRCAKFLSGKSICQSENKENDWRNHKRYRLLFDLVCVSLMVWLLYVFVTS